MKQFQKKNNGFSLIEVVIVLAIFSMTALVATDIFLAVSKNQSRFTAFQSVEADSRFVITIVSKSVQFGSIDYDFYENPDNDTTTDDAVDLSTGFTHMLAVRDENNQQILFRRKGSVQNPWDGTGQDMEECKNDANNICADDINAWSRLNSKDVLVTNAKFFISPSADPWVLSNDGKYISDIHPRVTVVYDVQDKKNNQKTMDLQTTIATRFYER